MGEIDDLFPCSLDAPESDEWRKWLMARLHVLGLFYLPIDHELASLALTGTEAWIVEKVFGIPGKTFRDPETTGAIRNALKARVVGPAKAPLSQISKIKGGLPPPPKDPQKPAGQNFAKIRVPGGYTFLTGSWDPLSHEYHPSSTLFAFGNDLGLIEPLYAIANPILGLIPLVAKVERRMGANQAAVPCAGVPVYFQLLTPTNLPKYDAKVSPLEQVNCAAAPKPFEGIVAHYYDQKYVCDPTDPQAKNAPWQLAGKRGKGDVADGSSISTVFRTSATSGFNDLHQYPVASQVAPIGNRRRHAVVATTNQNGEAGVIFTPSRIGGDRYRLRAFVESPGPANAVLESGSETGTMVVWRNLRISQCLQIGQGPFAGQPHPFDIREMRERLSPAFLELEVDGDPPILQPSSLTQDQYQIAMSEAIRDATQVDERIEGGYDLTSLVVKPDQATLNATSTPFHLVDPGLYDQKHGGVFSNDIHIDTDQGIRLDPGDWVNLERILADGLHGGFLRGLSKCGFLPGMTYLYTFPESTWQTQGIADRIFGGKAFPYRGCYVLRRDLSTVLHELGHCLYLEHGPWLVSSLQAVAQQVKDPSGKSDAAKFKKRTNIRSKIEEHDTPLSWAHACLMSYNVDPSQQDPYPTHFCGHCTLTLRGCHDPSLQIAWDWILSRTSDDAK